ncbi:Csu type fimbrial protein [Roseinatronobacter bogoriensis]|nr:MULTISPECIES: spore coat U domain-containing protein [Rhodobaca]MBB4209729.1 spore coat protein U-like protein [Rhodobaca bogoriensis DSM 18756]
MSTRAENRKKNSRAENEKAGKMKRGTLTRFVGIWGIFFITPPNVAVSQTSTATFDVTIEIVAECEVTSTQTLDFGPAGVLTTEIDAASDIEVTCTPDVAYSIGLDEGTGDGATTSVRRMTGAGETIDYGLFQDAARNVNWGNAPPTDTVSATGTGSAQVYTVYGRVPPQATPSEGIYSDTITVTVTY